MTYLMPFVRHPHPGSHDQLLGLFSQQHVCMSGDDVTFFALGYEVGVEPRLYDNSVSPFLTRLIFARCDAVTQHMTKNSGVAANVPTLILTATELSASRDQSPFFVYAIWRGLSNRPPRGTIIRCSVVGGSGDHLRGEVGWCLVTERRMWALCVVVHGPNLQ